MRIPVLMYHRIAPCPRGTLVPGHYVSPPQFQRHLYALHRRGYETVTLQHMADGLRGSTPLPSKPIVLTFDDGYTNFIEAAVPVMCEFGMVGTVFVVSGQLGGTNSWDHNRGDTEEHLMTEEQIRLCADLGMEVGSHTVTHAHLTAVGLAEAESEIRASKEHIECVLSKEVTSFCYPYGEQNAAIQELVREAGYRSACGTLRGLNDAQTNPFLWRRINVRRTTSTPQLMWKIARAARQP